MIQYPGVSEIEFRFYEVLRESILDGLKNVLGETGMKAVSLRIELTRHVDDPTELHDSLHEVFKDGALVLEKVIAQELSRRLGVPYEETGDFDFVMYVDHARRIFVTNRTARRRRQL